jgi:hypothetical protein
MMNLLIKDGRQTNPGCLISKLQSYNTPIIRVKIRVVCEQAIIARQSDGTTGEKKTGDEVPPVIQAIRSATPSPSKKRGEEKALVSQLFHIEYKKCLWEIQIGESGFVKKTSNFVPIYDIGTTPDPHQRNVRAGKSPW